MGLETLKTKYFIPKKFNVALIPVAKTNAKIIEKELGTNMYNIEVLSVTLMTRLSA